MERERERTRNPNHKIELIELKKEKLWIKDEISKLEQLEFNYDEHQGGVESFR